MFDKFGEMDSAAEINMAADGLLKENDTENIIILAKENGIDEEDARDFINGDVQELCTDLMAAVGKLQMETDEINKDDKGIERMPLLLIIQMTKTMCTDQELAKAIRKKGKRNKEIYKLMKDEAGKHRIGSMGVSCGTDKQLREIIEAYYLNKNPKKILESLYE